MLPLIVWGVVREFIGHGIGTEFHGDLQVLHYYDKRASARLEEAMTFTIEPMLTLGSSMASMWGRRLDGRHRRRPSHGSVRAHSRMHVRRCGDPDAHHSRRVRPRPVR